MKNHTTYLQLFWEVKTEALPFLFNCPTSLTRNTRTYFFAQGGKVIINLTINYICVNSK